MRVYERNRCIESDEKREIARQRFGEVDDFFFFCSQDSRRSAAERKMGLAAAAAAGSIESCIRTTAAALWGSLSLHFIHPQLSVRAHLDAF